MGTMRDAAARQRLLREAAYQLIDLVSKLNESGEDLVPRWDKCPASCSIPTASTTRTRWSPHLSEVAFGLPEVPVHLQTKPELR